MSLRNIEQPPRLSKEEAADVYQLAKLMSRDGLIYDLDAQNQRTGYQRLENWNPATDCGFIVLRHQFVAGDFDGPDGMEKAKKLARLCPYPCHVFSSGPGSHRAHLFIQIETAKQREFWIERIIEEGGDARTEAKGIRPPGTLHRTGQTRSSSISGWQYKDVLNLFTTGERPESKRGRSLEALAAESIEKGYRSERLYLIAAESFRQGKSIEWILELLERNPKGAGSKLRKHSPKAKRKYIETIWKSVSKGQPKPEDRQSRWVEYVLSDPEIKASRLNMSPAVREIADTSRLQHGRPIHMSQRELGDKLNRNPSSARKVIQILLKRGYLNLLSKTGFGKFASVYDLNFPQRESLNPCKGSMGATNRVVAFGEILKHDSMSGRNGMARYFECMHPSEPATPAEIARRADRSVKSVYRQLKEMLRLKIAAKKGRGYIRIEDPAAHRDAAQMRGTQGRAQRRKLINELQRNGWREELKRRQEQRAQELRRKNLKDSVQGKEPDPESKQTDSSTGIEDTEPQSRILCPLRL